jgi:hypothetical protein
MLLSQLQETAVNHDEIIARVVALAMPLTVKDAKNNKRTLTTVGEAARFIHANFSRQRSDQVDWEHAANALEVAAETNDAERRQHATEVVVALLRAEGMLVG